MSRGERKLLAICLLACAAAVLALARAREPLPHDPASAPRARAVPSDAGVLGAGAAALRDGHPIDVNRASAAELVLLPGVGPALAERILAHREAEGPFEGIEAITAVRGIGPRTLERLRPFAVAAPSP